MISGGGNGGDTILSKLADILLYLANGDDASISLRRLASLAGSLIGGAMDFATILGSGNCNLFDAFAGAAIAGVISVYLTNLSFILVAAIINPLFLVIAIALITTIINFVRELFVSAVIASCDARNEG